MVLGVDGKWRSSRRRDGFFDAIEVVKVSFINGF